MTCVLVVSSLCAILIATLYLYIKHVYSYWERRGVAYLKPSIPFGNFGPMARKVRSIGQNIHDLYYATSEPFIGVYLGTCLYHCFVRMATLWYCGKFW